MGFLQNGILMAIIAHGLIGISLLWDKILLGQRGTQNLVSYVFWMGAISVFGSILAFFGFKMPPLEYAAIAFAAGALQLVAVFFYFMALKMGEASESLAVMGGFSPVATALIAIGLLEEPLGGASIPGFVLMVAGGFVMFLTESVDYRRLLPPVLLASGLYGLVNVTQKIAFNHSNFVSGYVLFTLGTFAGAMLLLVRRSWREQIFRNTGTAEPRSKIAYFTNRFFNGFGSFLVFYAISLANPAVVDAISGVRYGVIFIGALLITSLKSEWMKENFQGKALWGKLIATAMVVAGLVMVGLKEGSTGAGGF